MAEEHQTESALFEGPGAEALFRSNANAMALARSDGRLLDVNDAFLAVAECSRAEVLGRTTQELGLWVDLDARPAALDELDQAPERETTIWVEATIRSRNGRMRDGLFSASRIELAGEPVLLTTMIDITERRRVERELSESQQRYRIVSELTSDYAYAYRVEPSGAIVNEWVTGALRRITGFDRETLRARGGWESLIHPEDLERPRDQLARILAGETAVVEYRVITASGEVRWMRDTARPELDGDGRVTHIYGAVQDITEQRRASEQRLALEAKIQQAQRLESLGLMAGGVAHDFNNLLAGILGNAELALMDLGDSPIGASIEDILTAGKRAAELVEQLLAYAGKGQRANELLDLRVVATEMAHLLRVSTSRKTLLRFELADEAALAEVDGAQIRQVVMNLISNAAESIGDDEGRITLRVGTTDLDASALAELLGGAGLPPGPYGFVEVSDTGCGMDKTIQSRIFDPFFTTKFTGRGLGLAAALGIVRRHKGAVLLRSEPDVGTTIRVFLPVATARAIDDSAARATPTARFEGHTALLVDDEPGVRSVGVRMLERLGMEVLTAGDGVEAIAVVRQQQAALDLVVLDLTMPRMDGWQCLRELRKLRADLPVVIATGHGEAAAVARLEAQTVGVVGKPYSLTSLSQAIAKALPAANDGARRKVEAAGG